MSEFYRDRRVLILGGLGFLGSNLAIRLVECGAKVSIVDSLISGHGANPYNIEPVRGRVHVNISDLRDHQSLSVLVRDQQVIFSLAAQVGHLASMQDPLTDLDINCRCQLALLECCRLNNPLARLVFTSTRQVYGRPQYLPVDEGHPACPMDVNGVGKHAAELYYALYDRTYGLSSVCLRLTNTYGPRLSLRGSSRGFVSVFLLRALMNARIDVFGTGEQRRDFNYVDDVVEALLLAGRHEQLRGQVFNLGHGQHHSILEFLELLQEHCPVRYRCLPFPEDRAAIDVGDYYADHGKFTAATGWKPRYDLKTGLTKTVAFFRDHRTHYWDPGHDPDVRLPHGLFEVQA